MIHYTPYDKVCIKNVMQAPFASHHCGQFFDITKESFTLI